MAKKNNGFGKFLAFTTAVAAIGGVCYIFRDRIKESNLYKKSADKCSDLFGKLSDKSVEDEDDFFFDDEFDDDFAEDVFSDTAKESREYTSITINPKADTETSDEEVASEDNNTEETKSSPADITSEEAPADEETSAYENDGLSDVSEDPDTLEEQDKLDF